MSLSNNNNISISRKAFHKFFYFLIVTLLIILFWFLRDSQVSKMINRQQEQVSDAILKTVNEKAKLDLFRPEIIFINGDSTFKNKLNDSLLRQIATILTSKYLKNEKINPNELQFQPFFIFPDAKNKMGNYTLTKEQLDQLKNHIEFLTKQVDKAVVAAKDECAKEIDRINTWISLWIAAIGILGVFIPIVINYRANEDLKEIKADSRAAKTDATTAIADSRTASADSRAALTASSAAKAEAATAKAQAEAALVDAATAKEQAGAALADAATAKSNALIATTKASKVEKLLSPINDISKIKDIDATFLLYNNNPLETLTSYLKEIHGSLNNCAELFAESIVKDVFRQLALRLHLIAPSSFITPTNFDLLNQFALNLSNLIAQPLTQETYNQALTLLSTLTENMG